MLYSDWVGELKKLFDENLLNPRTNWIHLDQEGESPFFQAPFFENFSYAYLLLQTHQKELVQEAFERIDRLTHFFVLEKGFSLNIGDYNQTISRSKLRLIAFLLEKIQSEYGRFNSEENRARIQFVFNHLTQLVEPLPIPNDAKSLDYWGEFLILTDPKEESFLDFDLETRTFRGKPGIEKIRKNKAEMTVFHLLAEFCYQVLNLKMVPKSLFGYLPLLDPKFLSKTYLKKPYQKIFQKKEKMLDLFIDPNRSILIESAHPISWTPKSSNRGTLRVQYPEEKLDERETIEELKIYFTKDEDLCPLIKEKKATLFSLDQGVTITNSDRTIWLNCQFFSKKGQFWGQKRFGNRPHQKEKEIAYDQIIGIRTAQREPNAELILELHYEFSTESIKEGLSTAIPMA